eukprot:UN31930
MTQQTPATRARIIAKTGATCTSSGETATCTCAAGYEGDTCETITDNCDPNPCQNSGVCTNAVNSFSCACTSGFGGDTCSEGTNNGACENYCENNGICDESGPTCNCADTGFLEINVTQISMIVLRILAVIT